MTIGVVLYAVAWFVPVWRGQQMMGNVETMLSGMGGGTRGPAHGGPEWLPGWQACEIAWELLVGDGQDQGLRQRIVGSTCLTNIAMVFALLLAFARRAGRGTGIAVLACAALNATWLYLLGENPFELYGVGYYLWLASFVLVGFGITINRGQA